MDGLEQNDTHLNIFFGEKDSVRNTTLNQVYLETEGVVEGYCAELFRN
jgi:hypothetical protein